MQEPWVPGLRRSFGERNGNPLQHSCLGNPMNFPLEEPGRLQSMGLQRVRHDQQLYFLAMSLTLWNELGCLWSLLCNGTNPFTLPFRLQHFLKTPLTVIIFGVKISTHEFWWHTSIQTITPIFLSILSYEIIKPPQVSTHALNQGLYSHYLWLKAS